MLTDRTLGQGGYGRVVMAINRVSNRQLACKVVDLNGLRLRWADDEYHRVGSVREQNDPKNGGPYDHLQKRFTTEIRDKLFREVELLKDISHVRLEVPDHTVADILFSLTSSEFNKSIILIIHCEPIAIAHGLKLT